MAAKTRTTTDHDEIRRWVESHGGRPASVKGTDAAFDPGMLRIDFPGGADQDDLEYIPWDQWFQKFEESQLALVYQEEKVSGEDSTFSRLIHR